MRRIAALNAPAERLKLKCGMGLADARAMHPSIEVMEEEPEADRRLLDGLADWCDRYTPLVALDGTDGLLLDITGCAHLFGGEHAMQDHIVLRLTEQGFHVRVGIASTAGAAWAATRFLEDTPIEQGAEEHALAALPLAALRLDPAVRASMESVGLRNVGAITSTPRAPLVRRFGQIVALRLDQALGRVEEAISPRHPAPPLSVERQLAEPILLMDGIETLTSRLCESLGVELERRGEGARALRLTLFRVDGAVHRIDVGTSRPLREPRLMQRLFHERLGALADDIDPGCGFELLRLGAMATGRLDLRQTDLAGAGASDEEGLADFVDRVQARLGDRVIMKASLAQSHVPERAVQYIAFAETGGTPLAALPKQARPIRLLSRAEPIDVSAAEVPEGPPSAFRWRRMTHRVVRAEGPERIAPEWWLNGIPHVEADEEPRREVAQKQAMRTMTAQTTRDYFRVEDAEGCRFWLYREGLYGPETKPRWFVHGLFA